jgi:SAM-dependent methyltransferase
MDASRFTRSDRACPSCGNVGMELFYDVDSVPVHSVLLFPTRDKALSYPKRDIRLGFCPACGFISNVVFDPAVHEYSSQYEETQGFSTTFQEFHRGLAGRLIERHRLRKKEIIEIGCGKGEFLTMLCEMGNNRGVGFDPAFVSERSVTDAKDRLTFVQDFYSERYSDYHGDFLCCKMTLEHIPDTLKFMRTVRRSIGDREETVVFFMIPEMRRILRERAFWDIYYEHCSYFTAGSVARLFRKSGFDVHALGTEYDGQYLTIEATIRDGASAGPLPEEESPATLRAEVEEFAAAVSWTIRRWRDRIRALQSRNARAVVWGSGSKGVTFLTKLGVSEQIRYAVDINPYRHGTFMAGTGQQIVSPDFLTEYRPEVIIVMNPIYMGEISAELGRRGLQATLLPITEIEEGTA